MNHLVRILVSIVIVGWFSDAALAQAPVVSHAAGVHATLAASRWLAIEDDREFPIEEHETIRKSFPLGAGQRSLDVDNIWGSIRVTGSSSDQVQIVVNKSIRAESKDRLEAAKKEVSLDATQQANAVRLYVNGPFRCQCDCDSCVHEHGDLGYVVKMDFELQVPSNIDLKLRTVNEGDVKVQNVAGQYSVHNVNGPIEMLNVGGSGQAKTVNGEVKVTFRDNPQASSSFASINGDVDLYFLPRLSADMRFKTFNGKVFTDFPMSALPPRQPVEERHGAKFVFHADRYSGGRIASGGPEIKIETLNGDIHIFERHD
jgi:hypothetical protein